MDKSAPTMDPTSDADRDTYEAAQNILKAINFGDLFQIASEGGADGRKADGVSVDQLTSLLAQAQNAISQSREINTVPQVSPPAAPLPTLSSSAGVVVAGGSGLEPPTNVRAELQAQLVLLAAQLVELSQEDAESGMLTGGQNQPRIAPSPAVGSPPVPLPQAAEEQRRQSSMVLEPPFMDALLPPPGFSLPESQSQSQERPPMSPSQVQPELHQDPPLVPQQDDIPIDPALQDLGSMVDALSSTPQLTESEQVPPASPASTVQPVSSVPMTTSAPSVAAPPPPPPPDFAATDPVQTLVPEPEPLSEKQDTTPDFGHEEADTDDDDMEEIA
jgi:hypothetical protein